MLKDKVLQFLSQSNSDLIKYFQDKNWLYKLCYLSDIFEKLNNLNLSLQGGKLKCFHIDI